jgi:hypothetical protein
LVAVAVVRRADGVFRSAAAVVFFAAAGVRLATVEAVRVLAVARRAAGVLVLAAVVFFAAVRLVAVVRVPVVFRAAVVFLAAAVVFLAAVVFFAAVVFLAAVDLAVVAFFAGAAFLAVVVRLAGVDLAAVVFLAVVVFFAAVALVVVAFFAGAVFFTVVVFLAGAAFLAAVFFAVVVLVATVFFAAARFAAGVVVAFFATAIVSLLLVLLGLSTPRCPHVRGSSRQGSRSRLIAVPAGVVLVPRGVALIHLVQCPLRLRSGGIWSKSIAFSTHVVAGLNAVVPQAPVVPTARSAVAHDITVHRKPLRRYRFARKDEGTPL